MRWSMGVGLWLSGFVWGGRLCVLVDLYLAMMNFVLLCGFIDVMVLLLMPSDIRNELTLLVRSVSVGMSAVVMGSVMPVLALMCAVQSLMCICMVGGTIPVSCRSQPIWAFDSGVGIRSRCAMAFAMVESSRYMSSSVRYGADRPYVIHARAVVLMMCNPGSRATAPFFSPRLVMVFIIDTA